ncbi:MAG TPA: hypothetical protein VHB97_27440, partial [Polyangia bacterium]|nr:hypothetical protein [Polyangia bacterium]
MATELHPRDYGARRVYETRCSDGGALALHLHDRVVELGAKEASLYRALIDWLPTDQPEDALVERTGLDASALGRVQARLAEAGVLYRRAEVPDSVGGAAFYRDWFAPLLPCWLSQA